MKLEVLNDNRLEDFIQYCKKHKKQLDDSFLYDEDLEKFQPNEENPTYVVTNEQGEIIAAASLIMDEYNKRGRKARFRIFHSEVEELSCYEMLMQAILKHTANIDYVYNFVPVVNETLMKYMEQLKFTVDRYSFLLVRTAPELPEVSLPDGYEIRAFKEGEDEEAWCQVRNASFATLKGSETPITPEMVTKLLKSDDYLEGGLMLLYHNSKPVGVVRGAKDDYEDAPTMNIGPVAVIPEYQGRGLGRSLLRASLHFAKENGYDRTVLCVNAENERAKALYLQEGFKQVEAVVCYDYHIKK